MFVTIGGNFSVTSNNTPVKTFIQRKIVLRMNIGR